MSNQPSYTISPATSPEDLSSIRTLFTAYVSWLDIDLTFQNFSSELSTLPGLYSPPTGALLLASSTSPSITSTPSSSSTPTITTPIGCIALRPLTSASLTKCCEIKRLYTSPTARGLGAGKVLITSVLDEAEKLGYERVRLDTLPRMERARRLYRSFGFEEADAYYDTPLEGTIFLGRELRGS
ncbi:putative GNAT family acetyltransferase [Amylocarpus encephaloides]|uniref:GNAT family acetyltransferase n=1 Tax=Amylocarpus encephaloides TaxID=45428 RepID=A0A9P7YLV7_9HELO|nr:putative GNAT family acetyltransferase [Amylocarpus encephaloides]